MRPCAALLAILLISPAVGAQKPATVPVRPKLDAGSDTNDARRYYQYGMRMVNEKPEESVRAFYWASQIDPASSDVLYALRTATLLSMTSRELVSYLNRSEKTRSPEYLAIDSLLYRAYTINPFLYRNLDRSLMQRSIEADVVSRYPSIDRAELNVRILGYMNAVRNQGWLAYSDGRFPTALDAYAKELTYKGWAKKEHDAIASEIHADRARIFFLLNNMDSARAEMTAAVEGMRARDTKEVVVLYQSKAIYEQSLGMIHEHANHLDDAREAYGEALQEDLSYFAAHRRLAELELAKGDTTGALSEMDLAVQLQPNDPALRYGYAKVLVQARHDGDAATQLMKAIAIDPYFAAPHLLLARIADVEQYTDDAVSEYQRYLVLAAKSDPELPVAQGRIAKLSAVVAASPAKP